MISKIRKYFLIIIFSIPLFLFSEEIEIAKRYIKKAYLLVEKNHNLTNYFLDKSFEYSKELPEYYHLKNFLLNNTRENIIVKKKNANEVIKNLQNSFLIDIYTLLKDAIVVNKIGRNYTECIKLYKILLDYQDRYLYDDYIDYIEMLFYAGNYKLMSSIIEQAFQNYSTLDLTYYWLLANIKYTKMSNNRSILFLNQLAANDYPLTKILYLKILYSTSKNELIKVFNQYKQLNSSGMLLADFHKKIIYEFFMKKDLLLESDLKELLKQWIMISGLEDYRTDIIIRNSDLLIENDEQLKQVIKFYTGSRLKDMDEDGIWEEYYSYENGELKEVIYDHNQDGVFEKKNEYYSVNKLKSMYFYSEINTYQKYNFNRYDNSLYMIENWDNNKLTEKIYFSKSMFFPVNKIDLNNNKVIKYIDYKIAYQDEGIKYQKYHAGKLKFINYDYNNDGFYEYKQFYQAGVLIEAIRDTSGDKNYDTKEKYQDGKLKFIFTRTDPVYAGYDYKEEILRNGVIKYWDENQDGIFEIAAEEYNGILNKKFDINFDGIFDYLYQEISGKSTALYQFVNGKPKRVEFLDMRDLTRKKGWIIISVNNIDNLEIPESIQIDDLKTFSGIFVYKGEKKYFKKGIIENDFFSFRIFILNGVIYLFDRMR